MKRICALLLLLCVLPLCASAQQEISDPARAFMAQKAMLLTQKLAECARDEVMVRLYSTSDGINDIISKVAQGDYQTPVSAEVLTFGDTAIDLFLAMSGEKGELTDAARQRLAANLPSTLCTQSNARYGTMMLAASSVLQYGDAFIAPEGMPKSALMVLHFGGDYDTATAFYVNEENIATPCIYFLPAAESFAQSDGASPLSAMLYTSERLQKEALSALLGD